MKKGGKIKQNIFKTRVLTNQVCSKSKKLAFYPHKFENEIEAKVVI